MKSSAVETNHLCWLHVLQKAPTRSATCPPDSVSGLGFLHLQGEMKERRPFAPGAAFLLLIIVIIIMFSCIPCSVMIDSLACPRRC